MSANFMTKEHAAGVALAARRGQLKPSELEGIAKKLHENLTTTELEELAQSSLHKLNRNRTEGQRPDA